MIYSFEGKTPVIAESAFVAPEATIIGDVVIGEDAAIFPGVVIRGDVGGIRIGARTNIQDNSVIHVQTRTTTVLGDDVTVGHMAMVHGEVVGNGTMVGMGATVLAYSKIGSGCIIGGGAVVLERAEIPDGSLAAGVPAKVCRELSDDEKAGLVNHAAMYADLGRRHAEGLTEHEV